MPKPNAKPWPCGRETPDGKICDAVLGYIVDGELTFDSKATTENVNLTILCPKCGQPKTWFPQPRKVMGEFGKALVDEIERRVIRRGQRE